MTQVQQQPHLRRRIGLVQLLALCDGLVWAELGAAMPGSGGTCDADPAHLELDDEDLA